MLLDNYPRNEYAVIPTPIQRAYYLAKAIGLQELLIKRDDNTGLAMGGNKARKLEFLFADAERLGADIVLTCGGIQSNHVRMTAAAANKAGMKCIIYVPSEKPDEFKGNLLLDIILDAEVIFLHDVEWEQLEAAMNADFEQLKASGHNPYLIPVGGSTPIGALGYVNAVKEVSGQLNEMEIDKVDMVCAVGSGGTMSGLLVGTQLYMPNTQLTGISVAAGIDFKEKISNISAKTAKLLDMNEQPDINRLSIYDDYVGEAYGVPTLEAKDAILLTAKTEGIILDPIYTGKAMAGLIDLALKGVIGRNNPVLFWHTGGAPALFANPQLFKEEADKLSHAKEIK